MPAQAAFVLGGGGVLGANEVGMLRALLEAGVRPDIVVGTSDSSGIGAQATALPVSDQGLKGQPVRTGTLVLLPERSSTSVLQPLRPLAPGDAVVRDLDLREAGTLAGDGLLVRLA